MEQPKSPENAGQSRVIKKPEVAKNDVSLPKNLFRPWVNEWKPWVNKMKP